MRYFLLVDRPTPVLAPPPTVPRDLAADGRKCWNDLFANVVTAEELAIWEQTIPRYECDCVGFYKKWKANHPPTFPLRFEWKWMLKSSVNEKLGKPNLTLVEAKSIWSEGST